MRRIQPQDFVSKNKIITKKWNEIKEAKFTAIKDNIQIYNI